MNFDNFPAQMTVLLIGWSFTVYLQQRSNRRAESLKRKDKIVDKLEELSEWLEAEIKKDTFSALRVESAYSGMVSQIELKISQLNSHVGKDVFRVEALNVLRSIEIYEVASANVETPDKIRESVADVVESIEECCDEEYFSRGGWRGFVKSKLMILNDYTKQFRGALLVLVCLLFILSIYQFYYKYMSRPIGTCVYGNSCQSAPGMLTPELNGPINYLEERGKDNRAEINAQP